jgi:arginine repressor
MIKTDGVGCSILFIRLVDNEPIKITKGLINKMKKENNQYIVKVKITKDMKKKRVVTVDPGKSDIIYCLS